MRRLAGLVLAMSATTVAMGGCAVGLVVPGPPPAAILEVRGGVPGPALVWVGGYWSWRSRWIWVPGSWVVPPRVHAAWVPGRWARCSGGWRWMPGYWR